MAATDNQNSLFTATQDKLIRKAATGDRLAFDELMGEYMKLLYCYILTRVGSSEDTSDVLQKTMLALWQSLNTFDCTSSFKTWLFGIANHKIADHFREKNRYSTLDIDDNVYSDDTSLKTDDGDSAECLDVKAAVASLTEQERELVYLVFTARLSYGEISEIKGIPTGTVKSRMSSIRDKLRKKLGDNYA